MVIVGSPVKKSMVRNMFFCFILLFPLCVYTQKIQSENLSIKVKVYWDANQKFLHSTGSYFVDERHPETTEKHGKWLFYSVKGILEEERYYFRDRIHGKQTIFYPDKTIKQLMYYSFNVPDSIFKEWFANKSLKTTGCYKLGSPIGNWTYFYEDAHLKSIDSVVMDTVYTLAYWDESKNHLQTINKGNGYIKTDYLTGGLKEKYQFVGGLKTGPFEERLANGRISIKGEFEKGKKEGTWTFYNASGEIDKQLNYHKDSLDGEYLVYFPDTRINTMGSYSMGKKTGLWIWNLQDKMGLEMKGTFSNDLQEGKWEYYFSTGALSYLANYKNGLRNGEWIYFYKDSTLFRQGKYLNDLKEGTWKTWHEDGTLLMEGNYEKGKEQGEWKAFWENGRLKNKSFFDEGYLKGTWLSYSPTGILLLEGEYKNGQKVGAWEEYYNNGRLKEESRYKLKKIKHKDGNVVVMGMKMVQSVPHGKQKAYSQIDYELKETGKFKSGIKTGEWINYYPGGVVPTIISQYKNGKLHGVIKQFGRRGEIMSEIHYKDGVKHGLFLIYDNNNKVLVKKMFRKGMEMQRLEADGMFAPD